MSDAAENNTQFPAEDFLLSLDDDLLAELTPLTEEELGAKFDELTELAINQPDDEIALNSLRQIVSEVRGRGQIDMVLQMAMTLGAMACLHPHLEDFAAEISASHEDVSDEHDHAAGSKSNDKDKKKSKKKGRSPVAKSRSISWPDRPTLKGRRFKKTPSAKTSGIL